MVRRRRWQWRLQWLGQLEDVPKDPNLVPNKLQWGATTHHLNNKCKNFVIIKNHKRLFGLLNILCSYIFHFLNFLKKSNSWFEISSRTVNSCQFSCSKYDLGFKLDCGFSVSFSVNNCNFAKEMLVGLMFTRDINNKACCL